MELELEKKVVFYFFFLSEAVFQDMHIRYQWKLIYKIHN